MTPTSKALSLNRFDGSHLMTRSTLLPLCFIVVGCAKAESMPPATGRATEEPAVTPTLAFIRPRIEELVKSGRATWHGAQFANQGLGCKTYRQVDRNDHSAFFFSRDGAFLGEFRDERLENGRFLEVTEVYLTTEARSRQKLTDERELPFVLKHTTFHWREEVCVGSTVRWQFITLDRNGVVLHAGPQIVETMVRKVVAVTVPEELRNPTAEYFLKAQRPDATDFERAFDGGRVTQENTFAIDQARLNDGQCKINCEWAEARPELSFELHERLPSAPRDASPFIVRTKTVSSMIVTALPADGETLVYRP